MQNNRAPRRRQLLFWPIILGGYMVNGRGFSYLGFSPLYIGEVYLGYHMLANTGRWISRFVNDLFRFDLMAMAIGLQLAWGLMEIFRCLFIGRDPIEIFRTSAFQYYSLYFFIGLAIGRQTSLKRFIKVWKYIAVYFALWFEVITFAPSFNDGYLSFMPFVFPLVPVGTIALWPYLRDWPWRYPVLIGSLIPILGGNGRGRGGFLGLSIGMAVIALSSKERLIKLGLPVVGFVTLMFFVAPMLPTNQQWATSLDPVTHFCGLIATNRPELAAKIMRSRGHVDQADVIIGNEGTAAWRKNIWSNALRSLNSSSLKVLGMGGGASMKDLVSDGQDIHTPHNFAIFVIYYAGWGGLAVTSLLFLAILKTGAGLQNPQLSDIVRANFWATLPVALTGNCLESPVGAIPFYMLFGLAVGIDGEMVRAALAHRHARAAAQKRELDQSEDFSRGAQLQYR